MAYTRTHGYTRARLVPALETTNPRVCPKCDKWFAARKREKICDGCSPAAIRCQRALKGNHTRTTPTQRETPGQNTKKNATVTIYSDYLGLTFQCPATDPRASSLLSRVLAYEAAAKERWTWKNIPYWENQKQAA